MACSAPWRTFGLARRRSVPFDLGVIGDRTFYPKEDGQDVDDGTPGGGDEPPGGESFCNRAIQRGRRPLAFVGVEIGLGSLGDSLKSLPIGEKFPIQSIVI